MPAVGDACPTCAVEGRSAASPTGHLLDPVQNFRQQVGKLICTHRDGCNVVLNPANGHFKVALTTLLVFQLALLALRTQNPSFQTSASIAADVLTFIATLAVLLISVLNHQRSHRPSTLLSLYLSASFILGIARVRTAWLLPSDGPLQAIATIIFVLTFVVLVLESIEAKKIVCIPDNSNSKNATPEQSSGFWARTCFSWLARTFYLGYSKVISLSDLPQLDPSMESHILHKDLTVSWDKCKHPIL